MIFNFQALGLLVTFVIIFIYYFRDKKLSQEGNLYKIILLSSYIMQLLYISTFVAIKNNTFVTIFSKLYLINCGLIFSLFMAYFLYVGLKNKYRSKQSIYLEKTKNINTSLIILNIITCLFLLLLNIQVNNDIITGSSVEFLYILESFYILVGLIILIKFKKYIKKNKYYSMLVIWSINLISLILALRFPRIPFINSSIIINVLFMYLAVENSWIKEIERLKLERDHAVKNNIEKSTFLTNMSHEIRTPLNTIDGFSQVIMDSNDIESIKEDARDIRIASKNLVDIINGIIDISIIESGKLEIMKENYNVYDMLENVISITNSKIKDKDIKFITTIDKDIPKALYGDSTRIEQVLLNLLNNAIKYTKKGSITLKVESVKSNSICRLKISIIDTGIGIKEEDLNRIFSNLEERDGKEREGYSLGLIVSKQLLDLMDGKIDVESTYGKGSTFVVTIDQKIASKEASVKSIKKTIVKPFDCKKKKILVVDDNKLNIKVVTKMLEPYNIVVKEAYSGQECLDILDKDNDFSLIFMDDLMPKMSGTETLDILKKIERIEGFAIPVVVLTANAITGMKEKYLKSGFDDYLAKPINKEELHNILKKFIKDNKD